MPHAFHVHNKTISIGDVIATQPHIWAIPGLKDVTAETFPVVSIVKGVAFSLVDLTEAPEVFARVKAGQAPAATLDTDWGSGLVGCLYYVRRMCEEKEGEVTLQKIRQRMIVSGIEDPGTGSAGCALACYLALHQPCSDHAPDQHDRGVKDKVPTSESSLEDKFQSIDIKSKKEKESHVFGIEQGVEMGRKSMMCVEVDIIENEAGERVISRVLLSGRAVFVSRGELFGTC